MRSSVRASGGIFLVPDTVTSMDTFGILVMTPFQTATSDAKGTYNLPALRTLLIEDITAALSGSFLMDDNRGHVFELRLQHVQHVKL